MSRFRNQFQIKHHPATLAVLVIFLTVLFAVEGAWAARGRPQVTGGTFVTDNGGLIRGAHWSVDINGGLPSRSWVAGLRNRGLNALHVYGERTKNNLPAGAYASQIDTLRSWTAQDGLYMLLTIGDKDPGGFNAADLAFAHSFWDFYAPRYKNNTHVFYEIRNEPHFSGSTSQPSPSLVRRLQRELYTKISSKAPNTPMLLFSYALFSNASGVISDINAVSSTVNWSKAGIAFHGYAGTAPTGATLAAIRALNIPLVQTEFANLSGGSFFQDTAQTQIYESTGTSWFTFAAPLSNTTFNQPIDQAGLIWAADFGTWPAKHTPPLNQVVSLRANSNNRYVSADFNASSSAPPLIADRTSSQQWEKFVVVAAGSRHVALRAQWINKYVRSHPSTARLAASQSSPGSWEHFEWLKKPNGKIVLKARNTNRFVASDHNLNWFHPPLVANRESVGVWEQFTCIGCP